MTINKKKSLFPLAPFKVSLPFPQRASIDRIARLEDNVDKTQLALVELAELVSEGLNNE